MGDAIMSPTAENDLLCLDAGPIRRAIKRLISGEDPNRVADAIEVEIEGPLLDPHGGWSVLRVGSQLVFYRPLTQKEMADRGRVRASEKAQGLGDSLIARIVKIGDGIPFQEE